jgi:hypothetical protein
MESRQNLSWFDQESGESCDLSDADTLSREFETMVMPHFKQEIRALIDELRKLLKSVTTSKRLEILRDSALILAKKLADKEEWGDDGAFNHDWFRVESIIDKLINDKGIKLSSPNA